MAMMIMTAPRSRSMDWMREDGAEEAEAMREGNTVRELVRERVYFVLQSGDGNEVETARDRDRGAGCRRERNSCVQRPSPGYTIGAARAGTEDAGCSNRCRIRCRSRVSARCG